MSVPDYPANPDPPAGAELSPTLRARLLDPSAWQDTLEKYT